jgi:hypothetical protein
VTNSWSLLYDEMNNNNIMNDDPLDSFATDAYEKYISNVPETDTNGSITLGSPNDDALTAKLKEEMMNSNDHMPPWGHSDMEALGSRVDRIELNLDSTEKNKFWQYEEDKTLKEIREYLSGTYKSHYTSKESKTQTLDLIESIGDAEPFCRSNAIKYLSRFGKKNGKSKLDILKAIHYCILLYHFSGLHTPPSDNYETF